MRQLNHLLLGRYGDASGGPGRARGRGLRLGTSFATSIAASVFVAILLAALLLGGCVTDDEDVVLESRDEVLLLLSNGTVVDESRALMWSATDNGVDISFDAAVDYVDEYELAGYGDWRLPTLQELESLLVEGAQNPAPPGPGCFGEYDIHPFIKLTCCCPWALQDEGTRAASFPFIPGMAQGTMWHHNSGRSGNRVLPVRDLEAEWIAPPASSSE